MHEGEVWKGLPANPTISLTCEIGRMASNQSVTVAGQLLSRDTLHVRETLWEQPAPIEAKSHNS